MRSVAALARTHVPRWVLWTLRAQIGLVYVFGGIAKLKYDWLVDAQPMTIWLSANTDFPLIGPLFEQPWVAFAFSYAGIAFDLSIVPLLLWRRTRPFAYVAVIVFHLLTARLFHLGMFPWIMMACSLRVPARGLAAPTAASLRAHVRRRRRRDAVAARARVVTGILAAYFALQIALPLRHFAYPGDVLLDRAGLPLRVARDGDGEGRLGRAPRPRACDRSPLGRSPERLPDALPDAG